MALIDVDATGRYRSELCDYYRFVRAHERKWRQERGKEKQEREREMKEKNKKVRVTKKERARKRENEEQRKEEKERECAERRNAIASTTSDLGKKGRDTTRARATPGPRSHWPLVDARAKKKKSAARRAAVARGVNQQSYGGPITIRRALISHNAPFFLPGRTTGWTRSDGLHVARGHERVARARSTFTISQ